MTHFPLNAAALPFDDSSFETVLCDPPYNGSFQWNHDLLCELSRVASKRIIFQHWFIPADSEGRWKKWHKFELRDLYVWQPRTYFGRGQLISVFDAVGTFDPPTKFSTGKPNNVESLRAARAPRCSSQPSSQSETASWVDGWRETDFPRFIFPADLADCITRITDVAPVPQTAPVLQPVPQADGYSGDETSATALGAGYCTCKIHSSTHGSLDHLPEGSY